MTDFWDVHGVWFIVFMSIFPRITMLVSTTVGGGFLYWIGWIFAPRLTVAILATYCCGHTNTFIVVMCWIWAFAGDTTEKSFVANSTP